MKGGTLIAHGNNTCVYSPAIDCTDSITSMPNHVSRIVPANSIEPAIQAQIRRALENIDPKYLKHFNLATKICTAKFRPADVEKPCPLFAADKGPLINMITPIQESDINRKEDNKLYKNLETTNTAIRDFLHALVEMNSYSVQVFHTDAHLGNFSWKEQTIVLHDWEKCIIGDENLLRNINGSTPASWNLLGFSPDSKEWRYLKRFPCWRYLIFTMRTFYKSKAIWPPANKLHLLHEIFFRFWDLLSIGVPLRDVYFYARIKEPIFVSRIMENAMNYFYDLCAAWQYSHLFSEQEKKAVLDEITNKIHKIIDDAYLHEDTEDKVTMNRELLKLVAQHSHNSPSKQVLYNMLPEAKTGGNRTRKTGAKKRTSRKMFKRYKH